MQACLKLGNAKASQRHYSIEQTPVDGKGILRKKWEVNAYTTEPSTDWYLTEPSEAARTMCSKWFSLIYRGMLPLFVVAEPLGFGRPVCRHEKNISNHVIEIRLSDISRAPVYCMILFCTSTRIDFITSGLLPLWWNPSACLVCCGATIRTLECSLTNAFIVWIRGAWHFPK